mgnify:CR=1 FL=1
MVIQKKHALSHTLSLQVRATRPVRSGAEITLSYLPAGASGGAAAAPAAVRRAALRDGYGFNCRCPRCRLEAANRHSVPYIYADAERASEEALALLQLVGMCVGLCGGGVGE